MYSAYATFNLNEIYCNFKYFVNIVNMFYYSLCANVSFYIWDSVCTVSVKHMHKVRGHSYFLRAERRTKHKAPPWEFVKTFQQRERGQSIRNLGAASLYPLTFLPALSVTSHAVRRTRQLCSETWGILLKYWKTKIQTSHWLSHNEAAVCPPCVHRLDLNWSPEWLPGTDGSSREQIVGYWGKKQTCSSLLTKGSV